MTKTTLCKLKIIYIKEMCRWVREQAILPTHQARVQRCRCRLYNQTKLFFKVHQGMVQWYFSEVKCFLLTQAWNCVVVNTEEVKHHLFSKYINSMVFKWKVGRFHSFWLYLCKLQLLATIRYCTRMVLSPDQ